MNIGILLFVTLIAYYLAYKFYSSYIAKVYEENDNNLVPSVEFKDGVDYVPTPKTVVFSHHFASIAGAGPIVGPTTALLFGYIPVWAWALLGTIFIGAVHDYTVLFTSLREKGKSVAEISRSSMGKVGFILVIAFTLVMILLVTSAFLGLTATALSSVVPAADVKVEAGKTLLKTFVNNKGVLMVQIGGIASTSVIVLTICSPFLGYLLYKRGIKVSYAVTLAIIIGLFSIIIGVLLPLTIDPKIWMIILSIYVLIAAGIPVWMLLQPRDFINSFILYIGIAMLIIGVIGGVFTGITFDAPAFNIAEGTKKMGSIWPFLFVVVACGAISGFHSLVAGGTVSKQISKESDARLIGYGGMILEGILATLVTIAVAAGLKYQTYLNIVYPTVAGAKSNPILAFALAVGGLLHNATGIPISAGTVFGILMIEGFVITTLDTAVRLNRYLFEELWNVIFGGKPHPIFKSYIFNAGLSVLLMFYLAWTNAFLVIWPIFGSANQLLAALALIAVTVWLSLKKKPYWFTLIPAIFMMITTLRALYLLLINKYLPSNNIPLVITDVLLIVLSIGVIILAVYKLWESTKNKVPA